MITPLVDESGWLEILDDLPPWNPGNRSILVIAPHPDDETLGAGGFIADRCLRGANVTVIAVTDGENAYADAPGLGAIRTAEQSLALERLGRTSVSTLRLRYTDSDVSSRESELTEAILPLVSASTLILAPWLSDFHPDHEACGRAALAVAKRSGARLSFYFFWTWHRGTVDLVRDLPLRSFPLNTELLLAKTEALAHHRSQLYSEFDEPILPERLLGPARRPFEVFLDA